MNRITIALAAIMVATPAMAGADDRPATYSEQLGMCEEYSGLAEVLARANQAGVPLSNIMSKMSSTPGTGVPSIDAAMMKLPIDAYDAPRFTAPEYQKRVIAEFRDDAYRDCIRKWVR